MTDEQIEAAARAIADCQGEGKIWHVYKHTARAALLAAEQAAPESGWRPIETAPKDRLIDVCSVHSVSGVLMHRDSQWRNEKWIDCGGNPLDWDFRDSDEEEPDNHVTSRVFCWRDRPPLPAPPESEWLAKDKGFIL